MNQLSLPGSPHVQRAQSGQLQLNGHDLEALAEVHGTPVYVYSRPAMQSAASAYTEALKGRQHLVCYAVKANSNLAVLSTFAEMGLGFDIVSMGELKRVIAAGGRPEKCVFSGVGKTREEMVFALEVGVKCFNVESEAELLVLSSVAASLGLTAPISLRVNPDVDAGTHPYISTGLKGNKFGIAHDDAVRVYQQAAKLPGIRIVGIDCHIGSQVTNAAPYEDALERLLDLVDELRSHRIHLHHIDLGGGLGITYTDETPPAAGEFVQRMLQRIDGRGHGHHEVILEPGRSLVGNAGVLLTRVLYLKPGETKNFCIVDAGMNDLARPAMYEAWMGITPCRAATASVPAMTWDVVGPVCESADWLGRDRSMSVEQGDVLTVLSAGAYGMTMASNYNTRPRAAEVMVDDTRAVLIRERETIAALWAGEHAF
jgi:diaminopimelate decarboxylase